MLHALEGHDQRVVGGAGQLGDLPVHGVADDLAEDPADQVAGDAALDRDLLHAVQHRTLALDVADRRGGAGLRRAHLGDDLEPPGDEVDQTAVDPVELLTQRGQVGGYVHGVILAAAPRTASVGG